MSYLKQLQKEKEARESNEKDIEKFKELIVELEFLVNEFDGEFLNDLELLIKKWKS